MLRAWKMCGQRRRNDRSNPWHCNKALAHRAGLRCLHDPPIKILDLFIGRVDLLDQEQKSLACTVRQSALDPILDQFDELT